MKSRRKDASPRIQQPTHTSTAEKHEKNQTATPVQKHDRTNKENMTALAKNMYAPAKI